MDAAFKDAVEEACTDLRNAIIVKIKSSVPPENAPSTLAAKAPKTTTLVDSGGLLGSITYEIVDAGDMITAEVGVFDKNMAKIALANEFGAKIPKPKTKERLASGAKKEDLNEGDYIIIPERSFLRSTYDENVDRIMTKLQDNVLDLLEKELLK